MAKTVEHIVHKLNLIKASIAVQDAVLSGAGIKYREREGSQELQQPYWDMIYLAEVNLAGLLNEQTGLLKQLEELNGSLQA